MRLWSRLRADLTRPDIPTDRGELGFHLAAPVAVVALAQATDPAPLGTLLLLVPALVAFAVRPLVARFPGEVFAAIVLASVAAAVGLDGGIEGAFFLSVIMVLYVAWTSGSLVRSALVAAAGAATPWFVADVLVPEHGIAWYPWATAHLFTFVLGRTLHHQRSLIDQLEAARQALAAQAVAEERRRIARELHDLAGHTLAAMVLHVTGARHVLRRDLAEAEAALLDAEAVGRTSLDQIRATVAALRTDERGTDPVLPGSADLPDLVAGYARAGLVIDAEIDAPPIDGPVGVALHRIAREALTNVARHAPRNRVAVCVTARGDEARLVVADHGVPAVAPAGTEPRFGLIGMAERARALGGDLEAGPTRDGWRVAARLPLAPARAASAAGQGTAAR